MSMLKTWYTLEEAAQKYGIDQRRILDWVEQGMVRSEEEKAKVVRVNVDDLDLKVQELTGI